MECEYGVFLGFHHGGPGLAWNRWISGYVVGGRVFLDDKARLAFAGRYDIFTGLGCDCVTRGGDRRLTEMLGWSIVAIGQ